MHHLLWVRCWWWCRWWLLKAPRAQSIFEMKIQIVWSCNLQRNCCWVAPPSPTNATYCQFPAKQSSIQQQSIKQQRKQSQQQNKPQSNKNQSSNNKKQQKQSQQQNKPQSNKNQSSNNKKTTETITTTKQSSIQQQQTDNWNNHNNKTIFNPTTINRTTTKRQRKQPQQHSIQQQLGKGQHIPKRSSILHTGLVERFFHLGFWEGGQSSRFWCV